MADLLPSLGGEAIRWMESALVHGEGDLYGEPFRLRPDEKLILWRWYEHDRGTWRFRRGLIETPKGYGKTEIGAAIGLCEFCGPAAPPSPSVPIGAASYDQANLLFGRAKQMSTHERSLLAPFLDAFETEIQIKTKPGRMFRVAAEAGTQDGGLPTLFLADEVHEWMGRKERVHLVIENGTRKRKNGRTLNLTTPGAGEHADGLAGRLHAHGVNVEAGHADDDRFMFVWHTSDPDRWDLNSPSELREAILQANVHLHDQEDLVEALIARYHEIPEHEFRRYHLSQWVSAPSDSWLADKPGAWDACGTGTDIKEGDRIWVGVDVSLSNDSTAVVMASLKDDRFHVQARIWYPEGNEIDLDDVMNHILDLDERYEVESVAFDPRFFTVPAGMLEDRGVMMERFDQSPERMVPACGRTYELIAGGEIVHDGDPVFSDQVESAVKRVGERGWTLSKGKSKRKIDACIGMVMALWVASLDKESVEPTIMLV